MSTTTKQRVYLDPQDSVLAEIDKLSKPTGLNRKQVVAEAISLYAILIEEIRSGRRVGVMDPATRDFIRIITPGLKAATPTSE